MSNNRFAKKDNSSNMFQSERTCRFKSKKASRFVLSDAAFPKLSSMHTNNSTYLERDYKNTVLKEIEKYVIPIEKLEKGWVSYEVDQATKNYRVECSNTYQAKEPNHNNAINFSEVALVLKEEYDIWFENYIELWGEEEYETMYKFSNYDIHHLDNLDEIELIDQENFTNDTNSDYSSD